MSFAVGAVASCAVFTRQALRVIVDSAVSARCSDLQRLRAQVFDFYEY